MKLLLAVYDNDDALENYFNSINDLEYVSRVLGNTDDFENFKSFLEKECFVDTCCVRHRKSLIDNVRKYVPDTLIISHTLPGEEDIHEIITKLTSSKEFSPFRIIYLYGTDDEDRREFINFLISNGIFDYYVGDTLTPSILNDLLINRRTRDDVKGDIVTTYKSNEVLPLQQPTDDEAQTEKSDIKAVVNDKAKKALEAFKEYRKKREEEKRLRAETLLEMRYMTLMGENEDEMQSSKNRIKKKKPLIPEKTTISIFGLESRTGCSHMSMGIASYVSNKKKVCIVDYKKKDSQIGTINNIPIYPWSELVNLYDNFDYIILDIGDKVNDLSVFSEIKRSRIKIIMCSVDEKYIDKLGKFIETNKEIGSYKWLYLFNQIPKEKVKKVSDLMEDFKHYCIPTFFEEGLNEDIKAIILNILKGK